MRQTALPVLLAGQLDRVSVIRRDIIPIRRVTEVRSPLLLILQYTRSADSRGTVRMGPTWLSRSGVLALRGILRLSILQHRNIDGRWGQGVGCIR